MPLLFAPWSASHDVALIDQQRCRRDQQPLDFTMSKFKTSSRSNSFYRQFYGTAADKSPLYENKDEQGEFKISLFHFI
jgi:hypothetical protein